MNPRHLIIANALVASLFVPSAFADCGNRSGPPPEAIESCAALAEGDACSFSGRNDEQVNGVCFAPKGAELACKPDDHSDRGGQHGKQKSNQQSE